MDGRWCISGGVWSVGRMIIIHGGGELSKLKILVIIMGLKHDIMGERWGLGGVLLTMGRLKEKRKQFAQIRRTRLREAIL